MLHVHLPGCGNVLICRAVGIFVGVSGCSCVLARFRAYRLSEQQQQSEEKAPWYAGSTPQHAGNAGAGGSAPRAGDTDVIGNQDADAGVSAGSTGQEAGTGTQNAGVTELAGIAGIDGGVSTGHSGIPPVSIGGTGRGGRPRLSLEMVRHFGSFMSRPSRERERERR